MPTYEYECDACGHAFERLQRMTDPAVRKCPSCGRLKVRRLISGGAGVIFKGSGFYETDYKRNRGGAHGRKRSGDAHADESSSKAESKPEPKPEPKGESRSDPKPDSGPSAKSGGKQAPKDKA
jgi:putative FmdB family regulatory protein